MSDTRDPDRGEPTPERNRKPEEGRRDPPAAEGDEAVKRSPKDEKAPGDPPADLDDGPLVA